MKGYKLFSGDTDEKESHYLVLKMASPGADKVETMMTNSSHMQGYVVVDDGWCVYEVTKPALQKIHIKVTKGEKTHEAVYDLSKLILEP